MEPATDEQPVGARKRGRPKKGEGKKEVKKDEPSITDEIEELDCTKPNIVKRQDNQTDIVRRGADFKPVMVRICQRFVLRERVVDEWAKLRGKLEPKDKLAFDLQLLRLGVDASPKDKQSNQGSTIIFAISGIGSDKLEAQQVTVDVTNPPGGDEGFEEAP